MKDGWKKECGVAVFPENEQNIPGQKCGFSSDCRIEYMFADSKGVEVAKKVMSWKVVYTKFEI